MIFSIALGAVAVLLIATVAGYFLRKAGVFTQNATKDLSKLLVYVSQPCLAVYTFMSTEYSVQKLIDIGIFALLVLAIHVIVMGASYLIFRGRAKNPIYRIMTVATTLSNCAFFGIPILEAIFPSEAPDLIVYTVVWAVVMNVIGWSIGSAIISQDIKYMSVKKMLINPALIGAAVAMVLFVFEVPLATEAPTLLSLITSAAKMSTPISMMVMGMRLAEMKLRDVFLDWRVYLTVAVNQFVMPLIAFLIIMLLPIDVWLARTFFVICACPVASVVLNYSEIVGQGQKEAASMVLVGTISSIITLPIISLLIEFIV